MGIAGDQIARGSGWKPPEVRGCRWKLVEVDMEVDGNR